MSAPFLPPMAPPPPAAAPVDPPITSADVFHERVEPSGADVLVTADSVRAARTGAAAGAKDRDA